MENITRIVVIGYVALVLFAVLGYGLNIIKFVNLDFNTPVKAEVIRGIGIITPIGALTGYMKIEDN